MKYNNNWLLEEWSKNKDLEFLFFWGHQIKKNGAIGKACFSQWFERSFEHEGIAYLTAEHWMMAHKAKLFEDYEILEEIHQSMSPHDSKKLGRKVRNFDSNTWKENRFEIVLQGNILKFSQHEDLKGILMASSGQILVEASPYDRIWGIGMKAGDQGIETPMHWKGLNLLGYALMEVRDLLKTTPISK